MTAAARQQWSSAYNGLRSSADFDASKAARFLALRRQPLKALHDGGVPVLLGSGTTAPTWMRGWPESSPKWMRVEGSAVYAGG